MVVKFKLVEVYIFLNASMLYLAIYLHINVLLKVVIIFDVKGCKLIFFVFFCEIKKLGKDLCNLLIFLNKNDVCGYNLAPFERGLKRKSQ